MISNCFVYSWLKHVRGEAMYLTFRRSRYSSLTGRIPAPVRWVAHVLLWPVFALYAVLYVLALETWPHFHWADHPARGAREFVPLKPKHVRWLPPILFAGKEREVEE